MTRSVTRSLLFFQLQKLTAGTECGSEMGVAAGPIHRRWGMRGADPPPVGHAGGVKAPPTLLVRGSPGGSTHPGTRRLPAAPSEGNSRLANGSRTRVPMWSHLTSSRVHREVRRIQVGARSSTHLRAVSHRRMGNTLVPCRRDNRGTSGRGREGGAFTPPACPTAGGSTPRVSHRRWIWPYVQPWILLPIYEPRPSGAPVLYNPLTSR